MDPITTILNDISGIADTVIQDFMSLFDNQATASTDPTSTTLPVAPDPVLNPVSAYDFLRAKS